MSLFFKTKDLDGKRWIFDPIRKKYVVLTPEEKVRQSILAYLVEHKSYPIRFIAVEKQIHYAEKNRRYDAVIYNQNHQPALLIECKQPDVAITQKVMEQATLYNLVLKVPFLALTNGKQHFVIQINTETKGSVFLKDFPEREEFWSIAEP